MGGFWGGCGEKRKLCALFGRMEWCLGSLLSPLVYRSLQTGGTLFVWDAEEQPGCAWRVG